MIFAVREFQKILWPLIWERRGLVRLGFERSAGIDPYRPSLKPSATALAATERWLQYFLNCSNLLKDSKAARLTIIRQAEGLEAGSRW